MKAMLVIDSDGPNPDFAPPDPSKGPEAKAAYYEYCATVPHSIVVPAGTILDDPMAWIHCFPDATGVATHGKQEGIIRAVPHDDQCKAVVTAKLQKADPKVKAQMERFAKKLPELLAAIEAKKTVEPKTPKGK